MEKVDLEPCHCRGMVFSEGFEGDLSQDEIQLLAIFMKHEWIKRCIATWENIRQLYAD